MEQLETTEISPIIVNHLNSIQRQDIVDAFRMFIQNNDTPLIISSSPLDVSYLKTTVEEVTLDFPEVDSNDLTEEEKVYVEEHIKVIEENKDTVWLPNTWGAEPTFIFKYAKESATLSECNFNPMRDAMTSCIKNSWIRRGKVHSDPGCLEISSGIMNPEDLVSDIKEFGKLIKSAKLFNMVPSSERYEEEGGCHIHLNMDHIYQNFSIEKIRQFLMNLCIFHYNNPWIVWGFNAPADDINARININDKYFRDDVYRSENYIKLSDKRKETITPLEFCELKGIERYTSWGEVEMDKIYCDFRNAYGTQNKDFCLRIHPKTVEFRYMIMPESADELEYHLKLVQKIYNFVFIETFVKHNKFKQIFRTDKDLREITYEESIEGLKRVSNILEMDEEDLETFGRNDLLWHRYFGYVESPNGGLLK